MFRVRLLEYKRPFQLNKNEIRRALAKIAEETKVYMRNVMLRKGCYSPRSTKHLADSIEVKFTKDFRVEVIANKPYSVYVDDGFRPSPGAYNPFDCLKPWKEDKKVYDVEVRTGGMTRKVRVVGVFHREPIEGKRKKARMQKLKEGPYVAEAWWQRPENYGKGKRIKRGWHPGFKGYHFTYETMEWLKRNLVRMFKNKVKEWFRR